MPEPVKELSSPSPNRIFSLPVPLEVHQQQKLEHEQLINQDIPSPGQVLHDIKSPLTIASGYFQMFGNTGSSEISNQRISKGFLAVNCLLNKLSFNDFPVAGYDANPNNVTFDKKTYFPDNSISLIVRQPFTEQSFHDLCVFLSDIRHIAGIESEPSEIKEYYQAKLSSYPENYQPYSMIFDELNFYGSHLSAQFSTVQLPGNDEIIDAINLNLNRIPAILDTAAYKLHRQDEHLAQYVKTNINELVSGVVSGFQGRFTHDLMPNIPVNTRGNAPDFFMDSTILESLLGNIIENAWKYGVVKDIHDPQGNWYRLPIEVGIISEDKLVTITVTDFGLGLSRADSHKFNDSIVPGRSLVAIDSGIGGAGIGLAYDREIAFRSGIQVKVTSNGINSDPVDTNNPKKYREHFTTFSIHVPIRHTNPNPSMTQ